MGDDRLTDSEARAALGRVLSSRIFEAAERHKRFLSYIVDETLAGRGDRIKAYSIAIEVFDRSPEFDSQADPLVRVEAGRLRKRLFEYYADEGASDPVRIDIPRGGYVPQFTFQQGGQVAAGPATEIPGTESAAGGFSSVHWPLALTVSVAIGCAAIAWIGYQSFSSEGRKSTADHVAASARLPEWPRLFVAPFANLSPGDDSGHFALGVTEEIIWRLQDFELLVIVPQTASLADSDQVDVARLQHEADADYILTGSASRESDNVRITARLVDARTHAQIWADAFDDALGIDDLLDSQEQIARRVVQVIAEPYGPIFEREHARVASLPPEMLDTYDCVLEYYAYRRDFQLAMLDRLAACFEEASVAEPGFADAWAGRSLIILDELLYRPGNFENSGEMMSQAMEYARRALDLDGNSYLAQLALLRLRFAAGDIDGFEESAARLMAMRPADPFGQNIISAFWVLIGKQEAGVALWQRALASSYDPKGSFFVAGTLAALSDGDYDHALELGLRIDTPGWFVGPMLEAVAAAHAGRLDIAARSHEKMLALSPGIAGREEAFLRSFNPHAQLLDTILQGLQIAAEASRTGSARKDG